MVVLGTIICAAFINNIACGEGTLIGEETHRKTKLSDLHELKANEPKRPRKDGVQVLASNNTRALGTDSSSITTEYAKEDVKKMNTYIAHCRNLLKLVSNRCDPLWINGTLCQDELQVSVKESDGEKLQESKGGSKCNNSNESSIENTAASPDQYLANKTRTIHGINNPTATENTKNTQDLLINESVDPSVPKNLPINHSDENHPAESIPKTGKTDGNDVPQSAPKDPYGGNNEYFYLSFGVNSNIPSFYTRVVDATEHISSLEKSKKSADGETSTDDQNHVGYVFCRIIDMENSINSIFKKLIENEILFGSIDNMVDLIRNNDLDADQLIKMSVRKKSLYTFIDSFSVKDCSYKSMQNFYFLFITYKCLKFDEFLRCWVLREELWEAHVYLSELYPYVLWKMEKINIENEATFTDEETYKKNLKEELKLLCIILELYREIKRLNIGPEFYSIHQSLINIYVNEFRKVIQKHIESFYASEHSTVLYYLAYSMQNYSCNLSEKFRSVNLSKEDAISLGLNNDNLRKFCSRARANRAVKSKIMLEFFEDIHQLDTIKKSLFILTFTVHFANIEHPLKEKNVITNINDIKASKKPVSVIFRECFLQKIRYRENFERSSCNVLKLIKLIKAKRIPQTILKIINDDNFCIIRSQNVMEKCKRDKVFDEGHWLIIYHIMIIKTMITD